MKKTIVLLALLFLVIAAIPAQATLLAMKSNGSYWGYLSGFEIDGKPYNVGAGRFHALVLSDAKVVEADTFSYCIKIDKTFSWAGPPPNFNNAFDVDLKAVTGNYLLAAWRVHKYDPFIGVHSVAPGGNVLLRAKALQMAVWDAVYGSAFSFNDNGSQLWDIYNNIVTAAAIIPKDFSGLNYYRAVSDNRQDQLVYINKVPEPATMMLLGIGLLGLGIVNRRRMKK